MDPAHRRTLISATKAEVVRQVGQLVEAQLQEVLAFIQVLVREPKVLTSEEWAAVWAGQQEVARGGWVRWDGEMPIDTTLRTTPSPPTY
jgi:hypothetical protein